LQRSLGGVHAREKGPLHFARAFFRLVVLAVLDRLYERVLLLADRELDDALGQQVGIGQRAALVRDDFVIDL